MAQLPPRWRDRALWWDEFRRAAAFLTRLPLGPAGGAEALPLAPASWAFPLIGVVVGLLGGFGYALALWLGLPPLAAALIAVGVTILATGALHEDGLADTIDALGGDDREERLAIMRDARLGAFGVLALVFSVGLRAAALAAFAQGGRATAALVAAHAVGRGFLPLVLRALPPARRDGLGAAAGRPEATIAWSAAALAAVIAALTISVLPALAALALAAAIVAIGAGVAQRRLGGYTGDVLGALEQGGETAVLLAAAAWAI